MDAGTSSIMHSQLQVAGSSERTRVLDITGYRKIDEFEESLSNFTQRNESGVVLHTETVVTRRMEQRIDEQRS